MPEPGDPDAESLEKRQAAEERFHDRMVEEEDTRGGYFYEWGLSAEALEYARSALGDVREKKLLDYGCGYGDEALRFARAGARVTAIDISQRMVERTAARAEVTGLEERITALRMYAEELDFPDEHFDLVFGVSILHHVDLEHAGPELHRVLKPEGKAVFVEPLAHNPLFNLFRLLTPHRRTETERPLTLQQIGALGWAYRRAATREFCLFSMAAVLAPWRPLFRAVMAGGEAVDRVLLDRVPLLRRYCWITVVELVK